MYRFLLILALSASLLSSPATARPLAQLSRTTTPVETSSTPAPTSSSSSPPLAPEHTSSQSTTREAHPPAYAAAASASGNASEDEPSKAEAPEAASQGKHRKHRSEDKSIAGGEVILGGLVTAIFAAVFCYIRVTRKKSQEEEEPIEPIKS